jgi:hypothetical protein
MRRRKISNRKRLEPTYAPTYTESGSFLKIPATRFTGIAATGIITTASIIAAAGLTGIKGYKVNAITFAVPSGSTGAPITAANCEFETGQTYLLTDQLKAARVKPSKFSPEGQWRPIGATSINICTLSIFQGGAKVDNGTPLAFVEVTIRYDV